MDRSSPLAIAEVLGSNDKKVEFRRKLLWLMWAHRDSAMSLNKWLNEMRDGLVTDLVGTCRTLADEALILDAFIERTAEGEDVADMTLGLFSGFGEGNNRINLSTLHSAKGREFSIVVLFGMDDGRIPRNGATAAEQREARRLFYVGFTRAESEIHMVYTSARSSPFVLEVQERLEQDAD